MKIRLRNGLESKIEIETKYFYLTELEQKILWVRRATSDWEFRGYLRIFVTVLEKEIFKQI